MTSDPDPCRAVTSADIIPALAEVDRMTAAGDVYGPYKILRAILPVMPEHSAPSVIRKRREQFVELAITIADRLMPIPEAPRDTSTVTVKWKLGGKWSQITVFSIVAADTVAHIREKFGSDTPVKVCEPRRR